jgi:N6-adenosine-specific RNA methylase IME4
MSPEEIRALPVPAIVAPDSALALWVTGPHLLHGAALLQAWGYGFSTVLFAWMKTNGDGSLWAGTGYATRANAEYVLYGRRGKGLPVVARDVPMALLAPRREHSRKPAEVLARLERLFGPSVRRLELFARERRPGWEPWGLEVDRFPAQLPLLREAAG